MKIVYIETGMKGHKLVYLTNLIRGRENESILITTERMNTLPCKQYVVNNPNEGKRMFWFYYNWLKEIKHYLDIENPDIVHFLSGDDFYRFFGTGLEMFRKYKVVVTLHWVRPGKIERFSLKCIAKKVTCMVVHSAYLKKQLNDLGIVDVTHIEYPQFNQLIVEKEEACKYWNIDPKIKTLACIGSTRFDKGIDLLINALKVVEEPFQLLIAGQVNTFTEEDLRRRIVGIENRVSLNIHYLTDEELSYAFAASDIIVLPYRKSFNGASGPLGEGVSYGKCIVGANHGNLGYTIESHHLGYTFESENIEDMRSTIALALKSDFVKDSVYMNYQKLLSPDIFRDEYRKLYETLKRN